MLENSEGSTHTKISIWNAKRFTVFIGLNVLCVCMCEVFSSHHKYKHKYEHSIAITLFSIILFNRIRIQAKYIKRCNLFEMRLSSVCITSWNCLALLLSGSPHFSGVLVRHPLVLYESCSHFGAIHIDILSLAHTHTHTCTWACDATLWPLTIAKCCICIWNIQHCQSTLYIFYIITVV